jgi:23S rRNA pseudouridine1911/1915/1917 synthase
MNDKYNIKINKAFAGLRVDIALSKILKDISRSSIKTHCKLLKINNKNEKFSYICKKNDLIEIEFNWEETKDIIPEDISLEIIYEDKNYIVINKPHNMVTHPAKGNYTGTVVNALLGLKKELAQNEDKTRIGIVHRLDKETSGLMIIAKNNQSHAYLSDIFKSRKITKKYHAIVKGIFPKNITEIITNIGRNPVHRKKMAVLEKSGKKSITLIEDIRYLKELSYLDIKILTGRTHQIRVHLSSKGFPVLGDTIYARKDNKYPNIPLCLVAYKLEFFDKFSNKNMTFKINDPQFMQDLLRF